MAIREVREIGDDILTKQCKKVTKMTFRTKLLITDMLETMYEKNGVGLAAPQVGVLKQIVVIDVGNRYPSGSCKSPGSESGYGALRGGRRRTACKGILP